MNKQKGQVNFNWKELTEGKLVPWRQQNHFLKKKLQYLLISVVDIKKRTAWNSLKRDSSQGKYGLTPPLKQTQGKQEKSPHESPIKESVKAQIRNNSNSTPTKELLQI